MFADLLERLGRPTPADAALGLERIELGQGNWAVRIPAAGAAQEDGRVSYGAMIVLADIGLATAVQAYEFERQPEHLPMATLNLRLDCWMTPPVGQGAQIRKALVEVHDGIAFACGALSSDDGTVIGHASAHFHLGSFPGGKRSVSAENARILRQPSPAVNFSGFLGLELAGQPGLSPHAYRFGPEIGHIGSTALPAYHGGVVASAMQAACERAVASTGSPDRRSSTFEYLRPAIADAPVNVEAEIVRLGRTTTVVHAKAWQDNEDRPIALGQMLLRPSVTRLLE